MPMHGQGDEPAMPDPCEGQRLTPHELKQRHVELHRALDELLACFIGEMKGPVLDRPILDLVKFSQAQAVSPTCRHQN